MKNEFFRVAENKVSFDEVKNAFNTQMRRLKAFALFKGHLEVVFENDETLEETQDIEKDDDDNIQLVSGELKFCCKFFFLLGSQKAQSLMATLFVNQRIVLK